MSLATASSSLSAVDHERAMSEYGLRAAARAYALGNRGPIRLGSDGRLLPEIVDTIHFRKGPYYADVGDFSAAGTASFDTFSLPPDPYAEVTAGGHGYYRLLGVEDLVHPAEHADQSMN